MIGISIRPKFIIFFGILVSILIYLFINRKKKLAKLEMILDIIIICYIVCLISITLFPIDIFWGGNLSIREKSINFIPFKGFLVTSLSSIDAIFIYNILGNLFLLAPIPILFEMRYDSCTITYKKSFLYGVIISAMIELFQYIEVVIFPYTSRSIDITDIFLNTLGLLIGHFIYKTLLEDKKMKLKHNN